MDNSLSEKLQFVEALALQDEIYQVWKKSREQFEADFTAYANAQPEEVRNMLWGFAGSGEMMNQRKVVLACEHLQQKK